MSRYFSDTNNILSGAYIQEFPYPHGVGHDCFSEEIYNELAKTRLPWELIAGDDKDANNKRVDLSADDALKLDLSPIWREFIEYHTSHSFYLQILNRFEPYFKQYYPHLNLRDFKTAIRYGDKEADIYLDCQIGINTPVKERCTVSDPHLDNTSELWACLFYMPIDGDEAGGDFIIYKCRDLPQAYGKRQIYADELVEYARVPYKANTMACFVNSPFSIHAVTKRNVTDKPRLLVNITLEFKNKALFNLDRMQ